MKDKIPRYLPDCRVEPPIQDTEGEYVKYADVLKLLNDVYDATREIDGAGDMAADITQMLMQGIGANASAEMER